MAIREKSLEAFVLYAIGFLLIWEWLRPLSMIADISNLNVFLFFLLLTVLFYFFKVRWYIHLVVHIVYVFAVINTLYFQVSFFSTEGKTFLFRDIFFNVKHIFDGEWMSITHSFRTLLFFLLLWLLVYLLHYWLFIRKGILLFFLFTVLFLAVVDTFFPYDAKYAIFRTFILGFFALGMLHFYRLAENNQLQITTSLKRRWLFMLTGVIVVSTTLGLIVPKAGPIWPDPIPYIQSYAEHHWGNNGDGKGIVQKIGYGEDDSRLGGPFVQDYTTVFNVYSSHKQYWRVETKDYYTGKGWEISGPEERISVHYNQEIPMHIVEEEMLGEEELVVTVKNVGGVDHIIYPYGTKRMFLADGPSSYRETVIEYNMANEKIYSTEFTPSNYTTFYHEPSFEINQLRNASKHVQLDPEFYERYTQLPESLPSRVEAMAAILTENENNWYDKAKAIERYLRGYEFTYDTVNVAVPGKDEDYVDQFLFDTQTGYCDNFSTSMVVLLRAVGIPARWAKGYTYGNEEESEIENLEKYVIGNNHAHSWVEVYFPGIGWTPFEPTKGFENPTDYYYDLSQSGEEDSESPPTAEDPQTPEMNEPETETGERDETVQETEDPFTFQEFWKEQKGPIIGSVISLLVLILFMYVFRRKWLPYWLIFQYRKKTDARSFAKAYLSLLNQLQRYGFERKEGETLRTFARTVDSFFNGDDMEQLTLAYERFLYHREEDEDGWIQLRGRWERLLKRTK